tara:strand:- start:145 stop:501 length:357 start_codon:yes stop_codon:yes gene_type:complete
MNYLNNYSLESLHRNKILTFLYNKIPSYALFNHETIENESVLNRYYWWKEIPSKKYNNSIEIKNIVNKWIQCFTIYLNKKNENYLKELNNSISNSTNNIINNNYCYSKRFTDELNCDI